MAADWACGENPIYSLSVPTPTLSTEGDHESELQNHQNGSKSRRPAVDRFLESSGVIWWTRYFDVMSAIGFLPFGIKWSPEARKFQVHQNWLGKLAYIVWTAFAFGATSEFFEIVITSQKPRIPDVQAFLAVAGGNLFLAVSVVVTWRRGRVVQVMNTFAEIWLERQEQQVAPRQMAPPQIFKRSQRWYITAVVIVCFVLLLSSVYVEIPHECGYKWTCITEHMCSFRRLVAVCSGSSPNIFGYYFTFGGWINTTVDYTVDLFLVTSVGFYSSILDDFTWFGDDEPVELVLKHHHKVTKLLELFNETTGLPMLLVLGGALPYYIGTFPDFAIRFIDNELDFEFARAMVCYFYFFGTYFWGASKYFKARERLRRWADRPETIAKAGSKMEVHMAILSLKTDSRLDFSPCGWFTIDPNFCKAVISFSATYAIILVQLQQSKPLAPKI